MKIDFTSPPMTIGELAEQRLALHKRLAQTKRRSNRYMAIIFLLLFVVVMVVAFGGSPKPVIAIGMALGLLVTGGVSALFFRSMDIERGLRFQMLYLTPLDELNDYTGKMARLNDLTNRDMVLAEYFSRLGRAPTFREYWDALDHHVSAG